MKIIESGKSMPKLYKPLSGAERFRRWYYEHRLQKTERRRKIYATKRGRRGPQYDAHYQQWLLSYLIPKLLKLSNPYPVSTWSNKL